MPKPANAASTHSTRTSSASRLKVSATPAATPPRIRFSRLRCSRMRVLPLGGGGGGGEPDDQGGVGAGGGGGAADASFMPRSCDVHALVAIGNPPETCVPAANSHRGTH